MIGRRSSDHSDSQVPRIGDQTFYFLSERLSETLFIGQPSRLQRTAVAKKNLGFPHKGRRLGYHIPEQVSNQEPPDSRPCVLTTTLLGGGRETAVLCSRLRKATEMNRRILRLG